MPEHTLTADCWCNPTVERVSGPPVPPVIGEMLWFHPSETDFELLAYQQYDRSGEPNEFNVLPAMPMAALVVAIDPDERDKPTLLVFPPLGPPTHRGGVPRNWLIRDGAMAGQNAGGWLR